GAASVAPMEVRIESGGAEAMDCRMHFGLVAQAGADGTGTERTILMVEDVTEQRRFERRLLAEQRHHHMGLIAGRLAHDFNNLMAAVLAQATVAGDRASRGLATGEKIDQVKVGARAAAALTGQLVSYAGNAPQARQVLDLGAVIGTVRELFEVTLPPGVDLVTGLAPDTPPVAADEGQLQQVIMNLLINAAQAMSGRRGTVQLNTRCVEGDPVELETWNIAGADLRPGRYAVAEVIDEGTGIAPDVLARMWDPFFTTAEDGHGLGLSVVRGIVRSHGGALRVTTRQGVGTTVGFVLPAAARPPHIDAPDTRLID
ncbi:MAG: ATP-binding protein, partial [Actinomycetota bacterium]